MKNYIVLLIFISSIVSAQVESRKSLLELKSELQSEVSFEDNNLLVQLSNGEKKSTGLAIIYSLLLPGMGELYAGDYTLGKYLTIADAVFWGAFTGFSVYGSRQQDNYKAFAGSFGGVELENKDDVYFATIGNYLDIEQYNRGKELNRDFEEVFDEETHYWKWASNEQRREYRNLWTSSEQAFNNVRFAVGALILNRIASAINAVRVVAAHNKKVEEISWNVSVGLSNNINLPTSLTLNFHTAF